jgi:hypothetical protein
VAYGDRPDHEQAALAYCAPRGIPLSVFLGRVVYPGEPQWLPDDTVAALDWLAYDMARCSGCGHQLADTVGPGEFDKWNAEKSGACDACRAIDRAARLVAGTDDPVPETTGARFRVWRDKDGD